MSRTLNRSIARALYDDFSKRWRKELREADLYGKPGAPRKPKFSQWYSMHQKDVSLMKESNPQDVAEYLEDPWGGADAFDVSSASAPPEESEERGVVEIPIEGMSLK